MAISIKNKEAYKLAMELSEKTGEGLTLCIMNAIKEKLARLESGKTKSQSLPLSERIKEIAVHCSKLPRLDKRSDDEIMGYDNSGMFEE